MGVFEKNGNISKLAQNLGVSQVHVQNRGPGTMCPALFSVSAD